MNSDQDTLPNNEQILKAILEMRSEIGGLNNKIDNLRTELNHKIDNLQTEIDTRFEGMRLQMMSFDVRIDRIEALTHEVLNVSYTARADVKVLREEVRAWAKDVAELQLKAA